ncbi:hypothetical protein [Emticicia sp. C21]|uniref:hypothetical protein n=1 Tax=Emticicia sp. C21 TaxID=2302915 RepID=UPI000E34F4C5|nr:hypothetical protein [Emticicia sp. C21]RFS13958.1 hypothetical protein D0T08_23485 [Emticicia sp. C21]
MKEGKKKVGGIIDYISDYNQQACNYWRTASCGRPVMDGQLQMAISCQVQPMRLPPGFWGYVRTQKGSQ